MAPCRLLQNSKGHQNHSVAVSSFDTPCVALPEPLDGPAIDVFYTGFMPTSPDGNPVYTVVVGSADPIWLFCSQGDHCRAGMVGVINPWVEPHDEIRCLLTTLIARSPAPKI